MKLLLALVLAGTAAAAPRLKDRPLAPYEAVVREGLVVYSPTLGRLRVVEVFIDVRFGPYCRLEPDRPGFEWECFVSRQRVAEWLRDLPENRRLHR